MSQLRLSTRDAIKVLPSRVASDHGSLGNRAIVSRYLGPPKPAIPPLGSEGTGTVLAPKPAISTAGSHSGRRSLCEVHLAEITLAIEQGHSAQWIYPDLVTSHAFAGS